MAKRPRISDLKREDIDLIMANKPDPNQLSAQQLADRFKVSRRTIYNIWERGELPSGGKTAPREKKPDEALTRKIRSRLRRGEDPLAIADDLMVVVRIVKQLAKQIF